MPLLGAAVLLANFEVSYHCSTHCKTLFFAGNLSSTVVTMFLKPYYLICICQTSITPPKNHNDVLKKS
jgi:hypothetical protein